MIIFLFSVALLVTIWLAWAIKGPQIYYNYRSEIVINAPITTVWKAINKSSHDFQSYSFNNKYSKRDYSDEKIINSHIENEIQKYKIEERVLSVIERSLIKTRLEKSGDEPFPVGKDSFDQIELFGKAPWETLAVYTGRMAFRDPIYGLIGFRRHLRGHGQGLKRYCETGERYKPKPLTSELVPMILAVASFAALSWQFNFELAAMFFGVFLIHELGHAMAFKLVGQQVLAIRFIPFLGAYVEGTCPDTAIKQAIVSLGGVSISLIAALACLISPYIFGWPIEQYLIATAEGTTYIGSSGYRVQAVGRAFIVINLFQLLPVAPLDGSAIVNAMLSGFRRYISITVIAIPTAIIAIILLALKSYLWGILAIIALVFLIFQYKIPSPASYRPATPTDAFVIGGLYGAHLFAYSALFALMAIAVLQHAATKNGISMDEMMTRARCIVPKVLMASHGDLINIGECRRK